MALLRKPGGLVSDWAARHGALLWLSLETALFVVLIAVGWFAAPGVRTDSAVGSAVVPVLSGRFAADAATIIGKNLQVILALLAGACTLGIYSSVVLGWNGYLLGAGLSRALARGPDVASLLALYVPVEFLAFVVAAGATQTLAARAVRCLVSSDASSPDCRRPFIALGVAVVLIVVAGLIEAHVAQRLLRR